MRFPYLTALALAIGAAVTAPAHADERALQAELDALRAEVASLRAAVEQLRSAPPSSAVNGAQRVSITASSPQASAPPNASPPEAATTPVSGVAAAVAPAPSTSFGGTNLWGYGELNYSRPTARSEDAQADLRRAVIGFSHAFDDATRVVGEIEWEHAIASAEDAGETEVEQLYIEHAIAPSYGVRAGLMLIPFGFINERHEPTNYYGVERNFVETAIVPTTWREGGVGLYGNTDAGFGWNVGIVTGPDLGAWDPTSDEGRESPLGSIHQELQLARARDPSLYASLRWQGIPGLEVGGSLFTGKIAQGAADFPAADARLVLGEGHVRWQPGPFDLSALYVRGTISDTQALNLTFLGQPTPVPKAFWGGYAQAAWRALEWQQSSLVPFLRYEAFNTGSDYAEQPQGLGSAPLPTERVWTAGINYYLNPSVVFKLDYQRFNRDDAVLGYGDRIDLGIGYQF